MSKVFYDHLLNIEEVLSELENYEIEVEEREEIHIIIDETFYHQTIDIILTYLPPEHHQSFLDRFNQSPHDEELLTFLKEQIENDIEEEIKKQAAKIKKEILAAIKKTLKK
ncbi:MAG: hypothetical protein ACOX50_02470 [Patescibacteria group bacterium]|jgi:hypothetical protein